MMDWMHKTDLTVLSKRSFYLEKNRNKTQDTRLGGGVFRWGSVVSKRDGEIEIYLTLFHPAAGLRLRVARHWGTIL
jgi:hypothetical protein